MVTGGLRRAFATVLLLVVTAAMAVGVRGDDPLATADLVRFLRAGISERIILAELRDRGFGEPLDSGHETQLRDAGATETLIVAVRRLAPASAPAATAPKGGKGTAAPADVGTLPTATTRVHGPTFGSSTRTVRVPVSVLDKRGNPVMGLQGEDFQIEEDGKKQEVTYFSGERLASRSPSTRGASMEFQIREVEAARTFIDGAGRRTRSSSSPSTTASTRVDFTSDRNWRSRARRQQAGATAFGACKEAIKRGPGAAEWPVVLVTDGMDAVSATFRGRAARAASSGARFSSVATSRSAGSSADQRDRSAAAAFPAAHPVAGREAVAVEADGRGADGHAVPCPARPDPTPRTSTPAPCSTSRRRREGGRKC